ncbi:hypothetical protein COLO4_20019 [Corchorus olitorius]|uniref:Uncharacterized protein n=1 Tax=Corchorus olitorius TaxID=93759 RepID=A0A1R3J2B0_9ROSI|nr:hypothetical protein COLO4_20019 [Corchorus olitorius]
MTTSATLPEHRCAPTIVLKYSDKKFRGSIAIRS